MNVSKTNCAVCGQGFGYRFVDHQLNYSAYAHCNRCGQAAIFNLRRVPDHIPVLGFRIGAEHEEYINGCECGGAFKSGAQPRCPTCSTEISTAILEDLVLAHFEPQGEWNRAGGPLDWRRAGGQFCMVIDERVVRDVWRPVDS